MLKTKYAKRHADDHIIDKISIDCVERWKSSSLSGSEWRFSYVLRLYRKGTLLFERSYRSPEDAAAHLPWVLRVWAENEDGADEQAWLKRIADDEHTCFQPGCSKPAEVEYRIQKEYTDEGDGPLPDSGLPRFRRFCAGHKDRGDGSREDNDKNYTQVEYGQPYDTSQAPPKTRATPSVASRRKKKAP